MTVSGFWLGGRVFVAGGASFIDSGIADQLIDRGAKAASSMT
jgi:hypothetical protein